MEGVLEACVRAVKVFVLLLLLPAVHTMRRLQLHLRLDEVLGNAVVGALFLTALLLGSAVFFISSLLVIHRLHRC